jgi:hypothetical protein
MFAIQRFSRLGDGPFRPLRVCQQRTRHSVAEVGKNG